MPLPIEWRLSPIRFLARCSAIVDSHRADYAAHEAHGDEYDHFWAAAEQTYAGFRAYRARIRGRRIPIMVMSALP